MYAVFASGGKQYRVAPGDTVRVERLEGKPGDTVELPHVLLVERDGAVTIGTPTVANAKVVGTVLVQDLAAKVVIFKKKRCKQYRRSGGHRQPFTALRIERIV